MITLKLKMKKSYLGYPVTYKVRVTKINTSGIYGYYKFRDSDQYTLCTGLWKWDDINTIKCVDGELIIDKD